MRSFPTILKSVWPTRIRSQLILGVVLVHLTLMAFFVIDLVNRQKAFLRNQNREALLSAVRNFALSSEAFIIANDFDGLERLTLSHQHFPYLKYAMILSPEGMVLAHSEPKYIGTKLTDEISLKLRNSAQTETLIENDDMVDIAVPVVANEKIIGWARTGVRQDYINKNLTGIIRDGIIYIIVALLVGTFFAVLIGNRLSKGLYKLQSAARKIKGGDRTIRVASFRSFELSELGTSFNQMLDEINISESTLQGAFEYSAIGTALVSLDGKFIKVNPELCRMLGYSEAGLLNVTFNEITHPETISADRWFLDEAINRRTGTYKTEKKYYHKDGSLIWASVNASEVKNNKATPLYYIIQIEDITEQKESELKFKNLVEKSLFGVYIIQKGKYVYVNDRFAQDLGYTPEEMLNLEDVKQIVHNEYMPPALEQWRKKLDAGIIDELQIELKYKTKNGEVIWAEVNASETPYRGEKAIIGTWQDITERKNAEIILKEQAERFEAIIENTNESIWLLSPHLKVLQFNKTGRDRLLLNRGKEIYMGAHFGEFLHRGAEDVFYSLFNAALAGNHAEADSCQANMNGELFWLRTRMYPIYDGAKKMIGVTVLAENITARKKAEQRIAERESQLTTFFENIEGAASLLDANKKYLIFNNRFIRDHRLLSGHDPYVGEEVYDFLPWELRQQRLKTMDSVLSGNREIVDANHVVNGKHIYYRSSFIPVITDGKVTGISTYSIDLTKTKEDELKVRESEEKFRLSFMTSQDAFYIGTLAEGMIIDVNDRFYEVFGYTRTESIGKTSLELQLYPDQDVRARLVAELQTKGRVKDFEMTCRTKGNKLIIVSLSANTWQMNGRVLILAVIRDITERKKAEQTIIHFNRLYQFTSAINEMMLRVETKQQLFSEACQVAITHGKFTLAWLGNYSAQTKSVQPYASAGYDEGYLENLKIQVGEDGFGRDVTGNAIRHRKPYYCNDIASEAIIVPWCEEALKRGYQSCISLPVIAGSKLEVVFNLYSTEAFYFNDEEVKLLQKLTNNIAYAIEKLELKELQKRSEEELKESEEKFRKLVEETMVGVFISQEGRFVYVNPQFEKTSGYNKIELLAEMSFEQLIHNDDLEKVWKKYLSRISGEKPSDHYILKARRKDGKELQVEVIVSTISYMGKPAIIGTIIDITEQAEEEIRIDKAVTDAQERERQQISMELHDNVNQIMAASILNIDFIKMNLKDDKELGAIIDNVKNYIRNGIDELRRISHRLAPSVDQMVSLEEKIKTVIDTMNISKEIAVSYQFDKLKKPLNDDVQLAMYRILQEQFSNIVKYAKASSVEIAVQRQSRHLLMSVKDNGVGFNTSFKKSGIGLENIRRRAKAFNGKVNIQSSPGKGCRLDVEIPVY